MKKTLLFGLLFLAVTAPLQAQTGLQRAKAQLPKDAARALEQTEIAGVTSRNRVLRIIGGVKSKTRNWELMRIKKISSIQARLP